MTTVENSDSAHDLEVMDSGQKTGITDEPKAARGLRSDWLATQHVFETYRGPQHAGFAATLCSQLQT